MAQLFQDLGTVALSRVLPVPQRDPVSQEGQSVLLPLGKKTYIMGILNATPDSFSDGGDNLEVDHAVSAAQKMVKLCVCVCVCVLCVVCCVVCVVLCVVYCVLCIVYCVLCVCGVDSHKKYICRLRQV